MNESVRDKAAGLASSAKEQARTQFDQKKGSALGELDTLVSALQRVGSELGDNSGMTGKVISTVTTRLESFSRSLDGKDLDGVVRDVETFARRNPAAFLGSAVAIGFLASRFLKSSGGGSSQSRDFYSSEAYGGYSAGVRDSTIGTTYGTDFTMRDSAGTTTTTSAADTPGSTPGTLGTTATDFGIGGTTERR
jgi:hypothetical protein